MLRALVVTYKIYQTLDLILSVPIVTHLFPITTSWVSNSLQEHSDWQLWPKSTII